jgi:16S rRNA (cytosine1402-N4)-methyltransferase
VPVLLDPVIAGLNLHEDGLYIDGTFGRGGHSLAILNRLGDTGRLLAIDRDPQAIDAAADALKNDPRFELIKGEFSELKEHAIKRNLLGKVDGLLLDLGVSSPQLDEAERGFSFQSDGPLDMRMDPTTGSSAADWLANVKERELRKVLFEFGEERFAPRIAKAIVAARALAPIRRTVDLAKIVSEAIPSRGQRRHPATKTFQAIRIRINDELQQLEQALRVSTDLLRPGGRLCVISFHSLEDRRVKRFMRESSREALPYRGLPIVPEEHRAPFKIIGKMISDRQRDRNERTRA